MDAVTAMTLVSQALQAWAQFSAIASQAQAEGRPMSDAEVELFRDMIEPARARHLAAQQRAIAEGR